MLVEELQIPRQPGVPQAPFRVQHRAVRAWLILVAALIFVIVLVGGATRLTESGLSIVEWKPLTGAVPPLSAAQWQTEFAKYQTIPQFRQSNSGMTLAEFKVIFWWEWVHRLLARLVGAVFLLPFLWFLWQGFIPPRLRPALWLIFGLGALQGAVGWWMVASGLSERTEVSQYRLAAHLLLPCLIFVATLWTAQGLDPRSRPQASLRQRATAIAVVAVTLLQIYLGALLAGLRGGLIYNTWPLIEGRLIPPASQLGALEPAWRNLFENILTVQFDHRMTAYCLFLLVLVHLLDVWRTRGSPAAAGSVALLAAVAVQASLGILTLLHQAPLALALVHQGMAITVLAIAALHAEHLAPRNAAHLVALRA